MVVRPRRGNPNRPTLVHGNGRRRRARRAASVSQLVAQRDAVDWLRLPCGREAKLQNRRDSQHAERVSLRCVADPQGKNFDHRPLGRSHFEFNITSSSFRPSSIASVCESGTRRVKTHWDAWSTIFSIHSRPGSLGRRKAPDSIRETRHRSCLLLLLLLDQCL